MTNIEKTGYKPVQIKIYGKDKKLLIEDLVLCAYEIQSNKIIAFGNDALEYVNNDNMAVVNPLKWGAVGDFVIFSAIMRNYMKKLSSSVFSKPNLAICVPAPLTEVESKAFMESTLVLSKKPSYIIHKTFEDTIMENNAQISKDINYYIEFVSEYYKSEYYN